MTVRPGRLIDFSTMPIDVMRLLTICLSSAPSRASPTPRIFRRTLRRARRGAARRRAPRHRACARALRGRHVHAVLPRNPLPPHRRPRGRFGVDGRRRAPGRRRTGTGRNRALLADARHLALSPDVSGSSHLFSVTYIVRGAVRQTDGCGPGGVACAAGAACLSHRLERGRDRPAGPAIRRAVAGAAPGRRLVDRARRHAGQGSRERHPPERLGRSLGPPAARQRDRRAAAMAAARAGDPGVVARIWIIAARGRC